MCVLFFILLARSKENKNGQYYDHLIKFNIRNCIFHSYTMKQSINQTKKQMQNGRDGGSSRFVRSPYVYYKVFVKLFFSPIFNSLLSLSITRMYKNILQISFSITCVYKVIIKKTTPKFINLLALNGSIQSLKSLHRMGEE